MTKKALISGVNGQDGIFLSQLLLDLGLEVYGFGIQKTPSRYLHKTLKYFQCDLRDTTKVLDRCDKFEIDLFFNLAGISSVVESFDYPEITREINFLAPLRIVEGFLSSNQNTRRFFQASSSEMFGFVEEEPQTENTPLNPLSPYAQSKAEMHVACEKIRNQGRFVTCAILYNHESTNRPDNYLTKKIAKSVAELYLGKRFSIELGNLNAQRDWGYAGDYMQAVRLMMEFGVPETFIVATGVSHSVLDMVKVALASVDLIDSLDTFVKVDKSLFRPQEAMRLVGDPTKAHQLLNWKHTKSFDDLINELVHFEIKNSHAKDRS